MAIPTFEWTEERKCILGELRQQNYSAAAIAAILDPTGGLTRSAVIGKWFRMKLPPPDSRIPVVTAKNGADTSRKPRVRVQLAERSQFACTLADLTSSSCRWIDGDPASSDYRFCGVPEADLPKLPYCGYHQRIARCKTQRQVNEQEIERRHFQGMLISRRPAGVPLVVRGESDAADEILR